MYESGFDVDPNYDLERHLIVEGKTAYCAAQDETQRQRQYGS